MRDLIGQQLWASKGAPKWPKCLPGLEPGDLTAEPSAHQIAVANNFQGSSQKFYECSIRSFEKVCVLLLLNNILLEY